MAQYLLALDQGTTSSRAILFDDQQNIVGISQKEFTQHYPRQGWVEQDPMEIYSSQYGVMMEVIAKSGVEVRDIRGIGITNQRDNDYLGCQDRQTGLSCHRLAVQKNSGHGGPLKGAGAGRLHSRDDRAGAGCLFFRN